MLKFNFCSIHFMYWWFIVKNCLLMVKLLFNSSFWCSTYKIFLKNVCIGFSTKKLLVTLTPNVLSWRSARQGRDPDTYDVICSDMFVSGYDLKIEPAHSNDHAIVSHPIRRKTKRWRHRCLHASVWWRRCYSSSLADIFAPKHVGHGHILTPPTPYKYRRNCSNHSYYHHGASVWILLW